MIIIYWVFKGCQTSFSIFLKKECKKHKIDEKRGIVLFILFLAFLTEI